MRLAWPILPLALILASCSLIIGALFQLMSPIDIEDMLEVKVADTGGEDVSEMSETPVQAATPVRVPENYAQISQQAAARIIARSPFIAERTAFSRTPLAPPPPPPPEIMPEFVGFLGRGEARKAMIIWQPGQQARTHRVGEETPWGTLIEFDENSLKFEGEKGPRQLELY